MDVLVLLTSDSDEATVQLFANEAAFMREEFEALTDDDKERLRLGYEIRHSDIVVTLNAATVAE